MPDSTRFPPKFLRRAALPHAVLASAWLALPGAAWAQQTPSEPASTPPPPPATPVSVSAGPEGFVLSTADKQFQLKLDGHLQADGRLFTSPTDKPGSNTFLIRRARPILEGTLYGLVDFRLMPDFGNGTTALLDAYVELHPLTELRLRVGKFKPTVGLELLQSDANRLFTENALPSNLVPQRDVGAQLFGEAFGGMLTYAVAVFNGAPDASTVDTNFDDNPELVARVFAHPFRRTEWSPLKGLGLGFSASRASQHGTATTTGLSALRTSGQQTFFSYLTGAAADTVVADGTHQRLSPQGYYYWGPFGLLAEYVASTQDVRRGTERARLRNDAWQVSASYVLFGGNASYTGVRPAHPLRPSEGGWGALELGVRHAELHVDPGAFPLFADPTRSARSANNWGAVLNWYLNTNARIVFDVQRTSFEGGAADGNRPTELALIERFQIIW